MTGSRSYKMKSLAKATPLSLRCLKIVPCWIEVVTSRKWHRFDVEASSSWSSRWWISGGSTGRRLCRQSDWCMTLFHQYSMSSHGRTMMSAPQCNYTAASQTDGSGRLASAPRQLAVVFCSWPKYRPAQSTAKLMLAFCWRTNDANN